MTITDQITALLSADPICGGWVTGETVRAIAGLVEGTIHEAPEAISKAFECPYCLRPNSRLRIITDMEGDKAVFCPKCGVRGPRLADADEEAVILWNDFIKAASVERTDLPSDAIERGDFGAGEG